MLIGYMRVSKADGSQTTDLQRDALLAADVDPSRLYEDLASGRLDSRPGLEAALKCIGPTRKTSNPEPPQGIPASQVLRRIPFRTAETQSSIV